MATPASPARDSRIHQLTKELKMLEETHQHTLGRKVELERTVENGRSQLRSLSALHGADKRHATVLLAEIEQLRQLLQGRGPGPSAELKQAEAARAVSEARAEAAVSQVDDLREATEIGKAENERQREEVALLRAQLAAHAEEKLAASRRIHELERSLRVREQRVATHDAQAGLLNSKAEAQRDRAERAQRQLAELQKQLEAQRAELAELARAHAEAKAKAAGAAALEASASGSRAELAAQLTAAEGKLASQADELAATKVRLASLEAESAPPMVEGREAALRPLVSAGLEQAEGLVAGLRSRLDEEGFARREAEGQLTSAQLELSGRRQAVASLEEQLAKARSDLRKAEEARGADAREMERLKGLVEVAQAETAEARSEIDVVAHQAAGFREREAALLAELGDAKRDHAEADHMAANMHNVLRAGQAEMLAMTQKLADANAEMVPLRQQAAAAKDTVGAFETRLAHSAEELANAQAQIGSLKTSMLRAGEVETRQAAEATAEAEGRLAQAQAEITGWAARQQLLLSQLAAEREAGKSKSAQLAEAQEALSSVRQLLLASKDEQLAEAHRAVRAKEADVGELQRRAERMGEQLTTQREELKLRAQQQLIVTEKLRAAEEALRAREASLAQRAEASLGHEARADGAAERLAHSASGAEALHAALASAHERIAALGEELVTGRARETLAAQQAARAKEERDALAAEMEGRQARLDALGEKVKVSREGRLLAVEKLEQRESELRSAKAELKELHERLVEHVEKGLRGEK